MIKGIILIISGLILGIVSLKGISEYRYTQMIKSYESDPDAPHNLFPEANDEFKEWLRKTEIEDLIYIYYAFDQANMSDRHTDLILEELKRQLQ